MSTVSFAIGDAAIGAGAAEAVSAAGGAAAAVASGAEAGWASAVAGAIPQANETTNANTAAVWAQAGRFDLAHR